MRNDQIEAVWSLLVEADDEDRRLTAEKIVEALFGGTDQPETPER